MYGRCMRDTVMGKETDSPRDPSLIGNRYVPVDRDHPYRDYDHPWNSAQYHSGKECYEEDCHEPAGTGWSPLWCKFHNIERMDRINNQFDQVRAAITRS